MKKPPDPTLLLHAPLFPLPPVALGPDLRSAGGLTVFPGHCLVKAPFFRSGMIFCPLGMDLGRDAPCRILVVFVRHDRFVRRSGYRHTPVIGRSLLLSIMVRFSCSWVRFARNFMAVKVCLPFPLPVCWWLIWMIVIGSCRGLGTRPTCAILWNFFASLISALHVCWSILVLTVTAIGLCSGQISCPYCAILWIIVVFFFTAYCLNLWSALPLYEHGHYCWPMSLFLSTIPLSVLVRLILFSSHCSLFMAAYVFSCHAFPEYVWTCWTMHSEYVWPHPVDMCWRILVLENMLPYFVCIYTQSFYLYAQSICTAAELGLSSLKNIFAHLLGEVGCPALTMILVVLFVIEAYPSHCNGHHCNKIKFLCLYPLCDLIMFNAGVVSRVHSIVLYYLLSVQHGLLWLFAHSLAKSRSLLDPSLTFSVEDLSSPRRFVAYGMLFQFVSPLSFSVLWMLFVVFCDVQCIFVSLSLLFSGPPPTHFATCWHPLPTACVAALFALFLCIPSVQFPCWQLCQLVLASALMLAVFDPVWAVVSALLLAVFDSDWNVVSSRYCDLACQPREGWRQPGPLLSFLRCPYCGVFREWWLLVSAIVADDVFRWFSCFVSSISMLWQQVFCPFIFWQLTLGAFSKGCEARTCFLRRPALFLAPLISFLTVAFFSPFLSTVFLRLSSLLRCIWSPLLFLQDYTLPTNVVYFPFGSSSGVLPLESCRSDTYFAAFPSWQTFLLYFISMRKIVCLFFRPSPHVMYLSLFVLSLLGSLLYLICLWFVVFISAVRFVISQCICNWVSGGWLWRLPPEAFILTDPVDHLTCFCTQFLHRASPVSS